VEAEYGVIAEDQSNGDVANSWLRPRLVTIVVKRTAERKEVNRLSDLSREGHEPQPEIIGQP